MKCIPTILAGLALAVAGVASAHTYVVDQAGGGDFTTIQAALDTVDARAVPDTILVHAGHYAEHLYFAISEIYPIHQDYRLLICPSGPDSTTTLDVAFPQTFGSYYWYRWSICGLGFSEKCICSAPDGRAPLDFERCIFRAGFEGYGLCTGAQVHDCDFYGRVRLERYRTTLSNLRFHHAPLYTSRHCGTILYENCVFEGGPNDTLVTCQSGEDMWFQSCTFDSGAIGLALPRSPYTWPLVRDCRFSNLAVGLGGGGGGGGYYRSGIAVYYCRFDHCTRAIEYPGSGIVLRADTLAECGPRGIAIGGDATVDSLVVVENDGVALDVLVDHGADFSDHGVSVTRSTFLNIGGTAVQIAPASTLVGELVAHVSGCRFEGCLAGAEITATVFSADGNVAFANRGAGLSFTAMLGSGDLSPSGVVSNNTSAFNAGDGFVMRASSDKGIAGLAATRNVSAQNGGAGFRCASAFAAAIANNDSWQNYGAEYAGFTPVASNLTLDPKFCDLVNGDLTVSVGSPCAPNMVTGPMGALGVGCDTELLGVPPAAAAGAFGVCPSPARGSVEFSLPARRLPGRVEVLDAQGRRVWSATVAAGERAVRWRGEQERGGTAGAGIYWARAIDGATIQTRRFVWLK